MPSDNAVDETVDSMSDTRGAVDAALERIGKHPSDPDAVRALQKAVGAWMPTVKRPKPEQLYEDAEVTAARRHFAAGRIEDAEVSVRAYLKANPASAPAYEVLAHIAAHNGFREEADPIFQRACVLAPKSVRMACAFAINRQRMGRGQDGLAVLENVLRDKPGNVEALAAKSAILFNARELEESAAADREILEQDPANAEILSKYAFYLKTVGQTVEAIKHYRLALTINPDRAEAWWGLANLQTFRFSERDLEAMEALERRGTAKGERAIELRFAIARANEQLSSAEEAFQALRRANDLRRENRPYDRDVTSREIDAKIELMTSEFFESRENWGVEERDPIFILGMPRAGSTLVEQILSSHSNIEGTEELYYFGLRVQQLANEGGYDSDVTFAQNMTLMDVKALGEHYLKRASLRRQTSRPRFTDKTPLNWRLIHLIHLALPNSKIIDIRRNPMDCCFANYRQHFSNGMDFAYELQDVGHQYSEYVRYMEKVDELLPGRVHRIIYEDLVDDLEGEVRRLLDYVGEPFEPSCLRFFETHRAVHTPSSEQVRSPPNKSGFGRWRKFQPWLSPLHAALGDLRESYR